MFTGIPIRLLSIPLLLVLAVTWALASADDEQADYPNAHLLATADWLDTHANDPGLVIVDVRDDDHFHREVIPGAIRLPWGQFRATDPVVGVAGVFVGVNRAQELLGEHGIQRTDNIVLYDSVERDGGATASYIFWVLDLLGHQNVRILDGGIDAWKRAGLETSDKPAQREPVLYQAPPEQLQPTIEIRGDKLQPRLGDRYFQLLDVRSRDEYLGEAPNADWQGRALKLGHIPGAYNIDYKRNWVDAERKLVKPYAELQRMYAGLDPNRAVVAYCHSGRRSSHTYFVLRLMGFSDVRLYDYSWNEWGHKSLFYPIETKENVLAGPAPNALSTTTQDGNRRQQRPAADTTNTSDKSGYISCGG
jgi:thiosulfate/3-mercaptopyruvate sulfurtransferase